MKRILLEFIGGPWDGMNLCNDSPDALEVELATSHFLLSNHGDEGATIMLRSDYAVRPHGADHCRYVVARRTEIGDEVLVRFEACDHESACEQDLPGLLCLIPKQIILQFDGGCLNGMTLDSQSNDLREALLAVAYYSITNHGAIGSSLDEILTVPTPLLPKRLFAVRSTQSASTGTYRIMDRCEGDSTITVRLVHTERVSAT